MIKKKKIQESKTVGNGRKYPQAILTDPAEQPDMFNGQKLSEIKSPTNQPIEYKFFTEKGSEYILSKTGECRRIKCEIHGAGEAGLHKWRTKAFFVDPAGGEVIESEFDDIIRNAFTKKDIIRKTEPPSITYKLHGSDLYIMYYSHLDSKWHIISSTMDMYELRKAERKNTEIPKFSCQPVLRGVSEKPQVGYHIIELGLKHGYIIIGYHPGHPVSYIENARPPVKGSIREIYEKCANLVENPINSYLKFNLDGNYLGFNGRKMQDVFNELIDRHGGDFPFIECFKIHGEALLSISEPHLQSKALKKTVVIDISI